MKAKVNTAVVRPILRALLGMMFGILPRCDIERHRLSPAYPCLAALMWWAMYGASFCCSSGRPNSFRSFVGDKDTNSTDGNAWLNVYGFLNIYICFQ